MKQLIKSLFDLRLKDFFNQRELEQLIRIYQDDKILDSKLTDSNLRKVINEDIDQLIAGIPIQFITGYGYFYDRKFRVNEYTLIPRPETEELVHLIIRSHKSNHDLSIFDIGTGTGCIPVILKAHLSSAEISSIDISQEAINIARLNASDYHLEIDFQQGNFLDETSWKAYSDFDILVSNPPYIRKEGEQLLSSSVMDNEPLSALFPDGNDPLIFYRKMASFGKLKLNPRGRIYVEINEFLSQETFNVFRNAGYKVEMIKDLQEKDRIIIASIIT